MIQLKQISLSVGNRQLFDNISCIIPTGAHMGVIGHNGAGKSTLLKVIAGIIPPSSGEITVSKNSRIGYLPQEEILASELTVFDEAYRAFQYITVMQHRIKKIEHDIEAGKYTDELLEELTQLHEKLRIHDQQRAQLRTTETLMGLGFTQETIQKKVAELSTGWKMRLALAKLLLTDADMYLFDEPTNHLDIVTQDWFLKKLTELPAGFLLVSHDRAYLEKACTSILEIERGQAVTYQGNLSAYIEVKEHKIALAHATRARQEREIAKKQEVIDRFRAGTRARQAQSLQNQIDRIELVEITPPLPTIHFTFPRPERPGQSILKFENISYGFNNTSLFKNISSEILRGERVALIAANGVGKTTLINCLAGKYRSPTGSIVFGHNVQHAFFEQDQARTLNPENSIFDEVRAACARPSENEIRSILGAFQFKSQDILKKTKVLSGGEKNRVAIVKVLLQRANFLILDEPTNHLDLYSKDILLQALLKYEGTILFVSHDSDFVSKLATRIIELTPTRLYSYPGTYEEYVYQKNLEHAPKNTDPLPATSPKKEPVHNSAEIKTIEKQILKLENQEKLLLEKLETLEFGSEQHRKKLSELSNLQKKLSTLNQEWEELLK